MAEIDRGAPGAPPQTWKASQTSNLLGLTALTLPAISKELLKYQSIQYTIEMPYKIFTKNEKKCLKFSTFVSVLGPFLKKQCFWKLGMAGLKRGPCPPSLHSFFMELNEEALLKVSLKNLYWFQSYKTLLFQKWP